jgi:major type 1 subunit fimbrin (pilin)
VRFDGSEDANTSGLLAIGSAGAPGLTAPDISSDHTGDYTGTNATPAAATGIAIGIYNQDHTPVKLYQSSAWTNIDTTSGAAEMKFIARYVQTLATVTPGTGNADSQFTVEYQK